MAARFFEFRGFISNSSSYIKGKALAIFHWILPCVTITFDAKVRFLLRIIFLRIRTDRKVSFLIRSPERN